MRAVVVHLVGLALLTQAWSTYAPVDDGDAVPRHELCLGVAPGSTGGGFAIRSTSPQEPVSRDAGVLVVPHLDLSVRCGQPSLELQNSGGQRPNLSLQTQNVRLQI